MANQWDVTLNTVILLVGLIVQLATLLFYAGKFANKIDSLERRMTDSETDIKHWQEEVASFTAITTKLDLLGQEMTRIRDNNVGIQIQSIQSRHGEALARVEAECKTMQRDILIVRDRQHDMANALTSSGLQFEFKAREKD